MEENATVIPQEQAVAGTAPDQAMETDGFLEGWDEDTTLPDADEPEGTSEAKATDQPKEEQQETGSSDPENAGQPADQPVEVAQPPAVPTSWEINYMGQRETVSLEQITPEVLQKAWDYDRVRKAYDETRPMMDMFSSFANKAGMNTKDYIAHLRAQVKQAEGLSEADARRAVELEDREAVISAKEADEAQRQQDAARAVQEQRNAEARRNADIEEFKHTFPDAAKDPKAIPPQVWEDVRRGSTLVAAYSRFALAQEKAARMDAERRAAAADKNQKNAERSTGSMQSAGGDQKPHDPFLDGWDS